MPINSTTRADALVCTTALELPTPNATTNRNTYQLQYFRCILVCHPNPANIDNTHYPSGLRAVNTYDLSYYMLKRKTIF